MLRLGDHVIDIVVATALCVVVYICIACAIRFGGVEESRITMIVYNGSISSL